MRRRGLALRSTARVAEKNTSPDHSWYAKRASLTRIATALALVALSAGGLAWAESSSAVRLDHSRGAGAEQCLDGEALRNAVMERLGYDPFTAGAERRVQTRIERRGTRLAAQVVLFDAAGKELGRQDLGSSGTDCVELGGALALAVSIAIDPVRATAAATAPTATAPTASAAATATAPATVTATAAAPPPAQTTTDRPPPPKPAASPWTFVVGAGGFGALGRVPSATGGGLLTLGVRKGWWGAQLAGRADLGGSRDGAGGSVEASMLSLAAGPSFYWSVLALTPALGLGRIHARGSGADVVRDDDALVWSAGLSLDVNIPLTASLLARPGLYADYTIRGAALHLGGANVWESPPLSGGLSLALAWAAPSWSPR